MTTATAERPTTVSTIAPADLERRRSAGTPIDLIDVRTPVEYAGVHAVGAVNIPLDALDAAKLVAGRAGKPQDPIYVICQSGGRGNKACQALLAAGVTNVVNVEGGTGAWVAAGLPVVRGQSKVISLERQVRIGAGLMVLVGVVLGFAVHPAAFGLSAFVGAGLVFAGVTDWCGMGLLLAKAPWNRGAGSCCGTR
jgi:rhodanese-related sulfurtransferase